MVTDLGKYSSSKEKQVLNFLAANDPRKSPSAVRLRTERSADQAKIDALLKKAEKVCKEQHNCSANYGSSMWSASPSSRTHRISCGAPCWPKKEPVKDTKPQPGDLVMEPNPGMPPVRPSTNYLPFIGLALVAGLFIYYRRNK